MDSPASVGVPRFYLTPLRNVCTISSMEPQHTITVPGLKVPTLNYVRILASDDERPPLYSELTGPASAFHVIEELEGLDYGAVKVVRPELVTIATFQTL